MTEKNEQNKLPPLERKQSNIVSVIKAENEDLRKVVGKLEKLLEDEKAAVQSAKDELSMMEEIVGRYKGRLESANKRVEHLEGLVQEEEERE
jgi:chromosome segregation ATPase